MAEERLIDLNKALGETGERLSLLGSVAKRLMMIATEVSEKRQALYDMAKHYYRAYALGLERGKPSYYPLLNHLTAQTLAYLLEEKGELPPDFESSVDRAIELAEDENRSKPDFWNTVTPVDCLLLRHLAAGDLPDHTDDIIARYARARNVGSPREFQSVLDQLDFLRKVIAAAPENEPRQRLMAALEAIRQGAEATGSGRERGDAGSHRTHQCPDSVEPRFPSYSWG